MKLSNYNILSENKSGKYVYNTFSGCLIQLEDNYYNILRDKTLESLSEQELDILFQNGVVVNDVSDELATLTHLFRKTRYGSGQLSLTIVPALGCNFACPYCYEKI